MDDKKSCDVKDRLNLYKEMLSCESASVIDGEPYIYGEEEIKPDLMMIKESE